ncbi:MAG: GIY-YIG nuclease family protein [Desulfobacterales bacterium]|nr:GIY-YIG nuclease family protein [Desulfobacterales bacterium]
MSKPYTIRLFVPDGEPNTLKIIDKMNWTGIGLEISREAWGKHKNRQEFEQAGIYILFGYQEGEDLPTLYIGQGDGVKSRIESHEKNKAFWDKVLVFISSNRGLNRAHITWLEWALIRQAKYTGRCNLENNATPNEPVLTESEKADTQEFLNEILSILPLVEIKVFEKAKKIKVGLHPSNTKVNALDTIIVPAQEDGFNEVFLGKDCWYAIRIGGGKLKDIKYIAAYQTAPISAITYLAEVESIEGYGDGGKYKLNFASPAKQIDPIKFGNATRGTLQGPRYTSYEKLLSAKKVMDLF